MKSMEFSYCQPGREIPSVIRRRYCSSMQHAIRSAEPDKQSRKASNSLGLTVSLAKTKVVIFRKEGHIGSGDLKEKKRNETEIAKL